MGGLFLVAGLLLGEDQLVGLASIVVAGCIFRGWPLVIVVLVEVLLRCLRTTVPRSLTGAVVWAPVGVLALLRAVNGGFGFAKVDVSLAVLGMEGDLADFRWAVSMILLSYALPFLLAVRVALAVTKRTLGVYLNVLLCLFVMCAGADLIFLALPRLQEIHAGRYEERAMFDVGLATLALAFQAARGVRALLAKAQAKSPSPVPVAE
jgi:hypothetical protein